MLTVLGRSTCNSCKNFLDNLRTVGIPFTFQEGLRAGVNIDGQFFAGLDGNAFRKVLSAYNIQGWDEMVDAWFPALPLSRSSLRPVIGMEKLAPVNIVREYGL